MKTIDLINGKRVKLPLDTVLTIGGASWMPGSEEYEFALPVGATRIEFLLDSTLHLNPGVKVVLRPQVSFNGGADWVDGPTSTRFGGPPFLNDGVYETMFRIIVNDIEQPQNTHRRFKVIRELTGGALFSAGGTIVAS